MNTKRSYPMNECYTSFTVTLGGITVNITRVTACDNKVEPINPPIKTIANGDINGFV